LPAIRAADRRQPNFLASWAGKDQKAIDNARLSIYSIEQIDNKVDSLLPPFQRTFRYAQLCLRSIEVRRPALDETSLLTLPVVRGSFHRGSRGNLNRISTERESL
jgi:hypothetical protein